METEENIYCEIPGGEQVETNELQSFCPQYEQLPGRCGDNDENTYTKVCPEREDREETHELGSCNTDSYLVPSPKIDSTYLTPSPERDSYLTPSPKIDSNYLTPSPKHNRMSDGKDNHVDGDGICPDDGYMYITPVHGPSSSS